MKKIALIGSTGSIGKQVINVVKRNPSLFQIVAVIANSSAQTLTEQINALKPAFAALTDKDAAKGINCPCGTSFFVGDEGALKVMEECGADVAVVACGGFAGLKFSLKAIELKMALALANKETLVCGGDLVMPKAGRIMPVDSEHSAIWQCLDFNCKATFKKLVITASGGPFRGREWKSLSGVTATEALNHPTWKMGAKITVDSATLLNKGYEIIEAHHLYNAEYDKITAVIHPQSIVHSMVQFEDGATLAQMSYPTMELPIQIALTYPERFNCDLPDLDFARELCLQFLPLERGAYPLFDLALSCGEAGGILPTALNAASEVAVYAFLRGEIKYTDIYSVAEGVVSSAANCSVESFEQLSYVDALARERAKKIVKEV